MKKSFKSRNISVYIVRVSSAYELRDSSPCLDCYRKMKELGVKRIIYSVNDGVVKMNLKDFTPSVLTLGRQFIDNGYNTIFRDRRAERLINYNSETDSYLTSDVESVSGSSTDGSVSSKSTHNSKSYKSLPKKRRMWRQQGRF